LKLINHFLVFLLLFLVLLVYFLPSLRYPFSMDAIHLIRPYSSAEITAAWSGHWDPDNIETVGWRPLYPLFFYGQWLLFGPSAFFQRLGLVLLMALTLTALTGLFERLTRNGYLALAASLLTATAMSTYYHATFLSDGIHFFALFFLLAASLCFLGVLAQPSFLKLLGCFGFYLTALLIREEAVSWAIALPLIAWLAYRRFTSVQLRRLGKIFISFIGIIAVYFVLRTLFLRTVDYPGGVLLLPGCSYWTPGIVRGIKGSFRSFDLFGEGMTYIVFGVLIVLSLLFSARPFRLRIFILTAIVLVMLAHTGVYYRSNLLFISVPFAMLMIALSIWQLFHSPLMRWALVIVFSILGILSAYQRQINFHPRSISALEWDLDIQDALSKGALADPRIAQSMRFRLNRFEILQSDSKVDREAWDDLRRKVRKKIPVLWPWNIPPTGAFAPKRDSWW